MKAYENFQEHAKTYGAFETRKGGRHSLSSFHPGLEARERTVGFESLNVRAITLDLSLLQESLEIRVNNRSETVFTGDENLLAARELELSSTEGLLSILDALGLCSDGDEDGADVDTGRFTEGFTVSVTHTGLKSISTGAGEHLVDADHMPRMNSDSDMETFLTSVVLHVLVSSNTGGFKSFGGDLFLFI